ncbi:MAG: SGNH hydrolase domain-containing protein, partial [Mangrovicoccus sp.]|nr:SGNH hydrolase domain-containing protein [Mangrovicoccus sp.]
DFVTRPAYLDTKADMTRDLAYSFQVFETQLAELQRRVESAGAEFVLVQQPPYQDFSTRDVYARVHLMGLDFDRVQADLATGRPEHDARYAPIETVLDRLAQSPNSHAVSFVDDLCDTELCAFGTKQRANYRDHDHLSVWIGESFTPRLLAPIYPEMGQGG